MSIAENVRRVLDEAAAAALRSGRRPEEVTVLAATKMNSPEAIREAIGAGIRAAGENRVMDAGEMRMGSERIRSAANEFAVMFENR